jgi:hypothetical protein
MVFSTESTAFTKKEKRTKKERKAAAADSLTSYTNLAPYTYKGRVRGQDRAHSHKSCFMSRNIERITKGNTPESATNPL